MEKKMFCYQCQETAGNKGCILKGVCGKDFSTANLMDLLVFNLKGIAIIMTSMRHAGVKADYRKADKAIMESLFATITNANFDYSSIAKRVEKTFALKAELYSLALTQGIELPENEAVTMQGKPEEYDRLALSVGILRETDEDVRSLKELTIYGLKGLAAYAEHADRLGYVDEEINAFTERALHDVTMGLLSAEELTALVLETGSFGVKVMALLDKANTETYGNPEITEVNIGVGSRPGILISGHDLKDMEMLLEQTEGTGIDVYTHGEMLPANYYPKFKKYNHFFGNYGNAWWKQREEFETFNGPILFTTNCIVPPKANASYKDRVFTTNATGYPGFKYIKSDEHGRKDFSEIIALAKTCQPPTEIESGTIIGGFAHHQVLSIADKVVEAVSSGAIRKFVVMSGCDGRQSGRNYYTEFAEALPSDTVILTSGCAKFRYNKLQLGNIGGIPRVLDAGQCNDSYSLAVIALKLKEVMGLDDINKLPIVYNIAWYEQKAVIVLLALLSLGVKNIHVGPTLPAFLSPNVAKVLIENFGIAGIGTVEEDIRTLIA
ncbi:hydroxylamine reductase [Porphyromonas gingivalis]|uniref:hydroxylamine reductase n=1 Tax=Porphyromonas gingivalis TaxID=837 RepID=UPI00097DF404|nr:hydroxylamine reductase [Porphyromonas gingivalis]ATS10439.1 hydroxylamine reductase [Porphyromonas gingivalis]MCE8178242.1 hydroxylamine reductase [Porphyromonas gingivalis]OWP28271.1 hydroxylamine reductase [Porphyromonas gingivalis]PDP49159.1 hydroxylamine reductase [Porphyromonas gingivalis]QUI89011.1 hydroxylamine reductase [Porphyromonas gingivalis]